MSVDENTYRMDWRTVEEVAEALRLSTKTVYRMVADGAFPNAVKHGRDLRIPRADVDAYLASRRVVPPAPVEGGAA